MSSKKEGSSFQYLSRYIRQHSERRDSFRINSNCFGYIAKNHTNDWSITDIEEVLEESSQKASLEDCTGNLESGNNSKPSTLDSEFILKFLVEFIVEFILKFLQLLDLSTTEMEKEIVSDESSPRGILEDCTRSLDSETDNSKTSTSDSEAQANHRTKSNWSRFFSLLKGKPIKRLASLPPSFPPVSVPSFSKRISRSMRENPVSSFSPPEEIWKNFTFSELQAATKNFSSENLIGQGGYAREYARVYKGCLQDGQLIAVKRLTRGTAEERIADFLSELGIIVHVNHPNTAKLIGYGIEGGMHLVLQLSPNGSLGTLLHDSKGKLEWSIRYKVALGTAEGLLYLHEKCQRRIIHRDIKASNILLTEDFEPQICDFGLAKWLPEQWSHHTISKFEGTFGYLSPEYFMHGIVDEKTDVFAFGVLLLELISGRRAIDTMQKSLVMWAMPYLNKINIRELADPSLVDVYDLQQMNRMVFTASLCIQHSSILRPRMNQVVRLLRGDDTGLELVKQLERPLLQRAYSVGMVDNEEYSSTRYLDDLNRHKRIAFEL